MKRFLIPGVVAIVLSSASAAHAQYYQKYFPVKEGNKWTYQNMKFGGESTFSIDDAAWGWYHLDGFPGTDGLYVAWSGNTLYAWDENDGQWEPFLRFGAPTGTKYTINLGPFFLSNVEVTVATKSEIFENTLLGQKFYNCVRFDFNYNGSIADAGIMSMTFAGNIGLMETSSQSIAGPVEEVLKVASINGKKFGVVTFNVLETGAHSQYPLAGTDKVLLINTQAAWESFYAKHNPGQPVPAVNFYKNSVVVALAGERSNSGYWISVSNVRWNFPGSGAKVFVKEAVATTVVIMPVVITPYQIVTTEKLTSITVNWQVVDGP